MGEYYALSLAPAKDKQTIAPALILEESRMNANVGNVERVSRLILGGILMVYFFGFTQGGMRWFGLVGLVLVATALIKFCPIWAILGVNTAKR